MSSFDGKSAEEGESRLKDDVWGQADKKRKEARRMAYLGTSHEIMESPRIWTIL
jgi:hypothetical protein